MCGSSLNVRSYDWTWREPFQYEAIEQRALASQLPNYPGFPGEPDLFAKILQRRWYTGKPMRTSEYVRLLGTAFYMCGKAYICVHWHQQPLAFYTDHGLVANDFDSNHLLAQTFL